jgi:hypothetical protein
MNQSKRLADFDETDLTYKQTKVIADFFKQNPLPTKVKDLPLVKGESFFINGVEYGIVGIDYADNGDSQIVARRVGIPFAED